MIAVCDLVLPLLVKMELGEDPGPVPDLHFPG